MEWADWVAVEGVGQVAVGLSRFLSLHVIGLWTYHHHTLETCTFTTSDFDLSMFLPPLGLHNLLAWAWLVNLSSPYSTYSRKQHFHNFRH